jgi:hypothetical protein
MHVLILSGSGRYQDRWHDFTATSVAVATVLSADGADVAVRSKPSALAELAGADLLVVNAGEGRYHELVDGPEEEWEQAFDALRRYRAGGGPVLALHAAANSLEGLAEWPHWIGGRWVRGRSMHPPIGRFRAAVTDVDHPLTRGLTDLTLHDERYSYLEVHESATVLLQHEFEGRTHPLVWAIEADGSRAVYDALGHDVRAYASVERVDLLRREVSWLTGTPG